MFLYFDNVDKDDTYIVPVSNELRTFFNDAYGTYTLFVTVETDRQTAIRNASFVLDEKIRIEEIQFCEDRGCYQPRTSFNRGDTVYVKYLVKIPSTEGKLGFINLY